MRKSLFFIAVFLFAAGFVRGQDAAAPDQEENGIVEVGVKRALDSN